jgi:light-harvesting complex I chlorophyll a/b binding protein 1
MVFLTDPADVLLLSLGLKPTDPEELTVLQTKEINNGRLAMIAIAGFVLQEVAEPGVEIFQHLFFDIEKEVIEELDDVEKELGLPLTPVPVLGK